MQTVQLSEIQPSQVLEVPPISSQVVEATHTFSQEVEATPTSSQEVEAPLLTSSFLIEPTASFSKVMEATPSQTVEATLTSAVDTVVLTYSLDPGHSGHQVTSTSPGTLAPLAVVTLGAGDTGHGEEALGDGGVPGDGDDGAAAVQIKNDNVIKLNEMDETLPALFSLDLVEREFETTTEQFIIKDLDSVESVVAVTSDQDSEVAYNEVDTENPVYQDDQSDVAVTEPLTESPQYQEPAFLEEESLQKSSSDYDNFNKTKTFTESGFELDSESKNQYGELGGSKYEEGEIQLGTSKYELLLSAEVEEDYDSQLRGRNVSDLVTNSTPKDDVVQSSPEIETKHDKSDQDGVGSLHSEVIVPSSGLDKAEEINIVFEDGAEVSTIVPSSDREDSRENNENVQDRPDQDGYIHQEQPSSFGELKNVSKSSFAENQNSIDIGIVRSLPVSPYLQNTRTSTNSDPRGRTFMDIRVSKTLREKKLREYDQQMNGVKDNLKPLSNNPKIILNISYDEDKQQFSSSYETESTSSLEFDSFSGPSEVMSSTEEPDLLHSKLSTSVPGSGEVKENEDDVSLNEIRDSPPLPRELQQPGLWDTELRLAFNITEDADTRRKRRITAQSIPVRYAEPLAYMNPMDTDHQQSDVEVFRPPPPPQRDNERALAPSYSSPGPAPPAPATPPDSCFTATSCSSSCGEGFQLLLPRTDDPQCAGGSLRVLPCSTPCPAACVWAAWAEWSPCTRAEDSEPACSQRRRRAVQQRQAGGGRPCDGDTAERRFCVSEQCQGGT